MRDLAGKVVVITGAGSGVGEALARGLAAKGSILALVDVNKERLQIVAKSLEGQCERLSTHIVDVSDRAAMEPLPEAIFKEHGAIDVLINNAGVSVDSLFDEHSIDDAEWLLGINLYGVIYGCKFFLPYLKQSPESHIVNMSSMFGLFALPGQAIYSASKAGVRSFTEALWGELGGTGVRITTVHPAAIHSNIIQSSRGMNQEERAQAIKRQESFEMPTYKAAAKIIRAIEMNRLRVLVGAGAYMGEWFKRLFPVGFQRVMTFFYQHSKRS